MIKDNLKKTLNVIGELLASNEFTRVQVGMLIEISDLLILISKDEEIQTHDITDKLNDIL